jgi:hypothetical protein
VGLEVARVAAQARRCGPMRRGRVGVRVRGRVIDSPRALVILAGCPAARLAPREDVGRVVVRVDVVSVLRVGCRFVERPAWAFFS